MGRKCRYFTPETIAFYDDIVLQFIAAYGPLKYKWFVMYENSCVSMLMYSIVYLIVRMVCHVILDRAFCP